MNKFLRSKQKKKARIFMKNINVQYRVKDEIYGVMNVWQEWT